MVCEQGKRGLWVVNLVRNKPQELAETELYGALEGIKDGMLMNPKFRGQVHLQAPPWVC